MPSASNVSPTAGNRSRWRWTKPATLPSSTSSLTWSASATSSSRQAAVRQDFAFADSFEERFFGVVFVLNLADDLFEDVLDRDDPGRAPVFVDDDREMHAATLQFVQQIVDPLRFRHDVGRPQDFVDREFGTSLTT